MAQLWAKRSQVVVVGSIPERMLRRISVPTQSICVLLADCTWEPVGNRLARSNYEATLLLVEVEYGWVSDSSALVRALSQPRTAVNAAPVV